MRKSSRARDVAVWLMVAASLCLMIYTTARNEIVGRRSKKLVAEIPNGSNLGGLPLVDVTGKASAVPVKGRYLISILDTQCGPCKQQVDSLNRAAKEPGGYMGVLAVFSEPRERVQEFQAAIKPDFLCLIDAGRGPVSINRITTFPQTVEINDGTVVRSWVGYHERFD